MLCSGQVYRSTLTVKNQSGAPSSVTLAITKPDGTLVSPAPTPGAGSQVGADWVVVYDYTLGSAGLFKFTWATTGPGTAPPPDYVNVRDFISIVSLAEVKAHLGKTSTADDNELSAFLMAATELVESKVGICVRRSFTDRLDDPDGSTGLLLPRRPVTTVTSITSAGAAGASWASSALDVDGAAGIISLTTGGQFWGGPWNAVYECGRAVIPERFQQAAKEQIRFLWDTQRGAAPPSVLQGEEIFSPSVGAPFTIPRRVLGLLDADMVPSL